MDQSPKDATARYGRMAEKTRNWGMRLLSLQCSVAQAVMLDEYENDKEGALVVLGEARENLGNDAILSRSIAKVHYRHGEHQEALSVFRGIADYVGIDSPIERAFALREAAISAAQCGEWPQAEHWFVDAQGAAGSVGNEMMEVMAIGLRADAAVAAVETGNVGSALVRFSEAMDALSKVNPESTLSAAYCHRVIRHAVLWAQSRVEGMRIRIGGQPIRMEPGTCSNPDPLPAVKELPLSHIDVAWYLLAEIEAVSGLDAGILEALEDRLEQQGGIPMLECSLRLKALQADIDKLDAESFASHFSSYLESTAYMLRLRERDATFDTEIPKRGQVPTLILRPPYDARIEQGSTGCDFRL